MTLDFNDPNVLVGVGVLFLLIVVCVATIAASRRRRRSAELRRRFGSEYDWVAREERSRRRAEALLLARVKRVERLKIRPLGPGELDHFRSEWDRIQARFVDHPRSAVTEADELVNAVMLVRGFPVEEFEQRAADISVNHARLAQSYRSASAITARVGSNQATTEELRTAMIHYRALFDELLGTGSPVERVA